MSTRLTIVGADLVLIELSVKASRRLYTQMTLGNHMKSALVTVEPVAFLHCMCKPAICCLSPEVAALWLLAIE